MSNVLNLVILGIIKLIDNIILTAKSIALIKNKEVLSSILIVVSQILFYLVIKQVVSDSSLVTIIIISVASGIGNYIAIKINNKYEKDMMWMNIITCSDKDSITRLCDVCIVNKIRYIVNPCYNRKWEETYSVIVFSNTKEQSKVIDKFISADNTKYLREIIK